MHLFLKKGTFPIRTGTVNFGAGAIDEYNSTIFDEVGNVKSAVIVGCCGEHNFSYNIVPNPDILGEPYAIEICLNGGKHVLSEHVKAHDLMDFSISYGENAMKRKLSRLAKKEGDVVVWATEKYADAIMQTFSDKNLTTTAHF